MGSRSTASTASTFQEYIPSREYSPARSRGRGGSGGGVGGRARQGGGGTNFGGHWGASDAYTPYSPYSPYSPYFPSHSVAGYGATSGGQVQDYFSSRGGGGVGSGMGQFHHHRYRDVEADLRPGYTSHFLPGSYTRTATDTQPTTRHNTGGRNTTAPSPHGDVGDATAGTDEIADSGMVAYGLGYDVTRQRMIYRRILAMDREIAGMVDRGYEGGDEDTGTWTSNSGLVSESASGRTSPYEERRRGSTWWGIGGFHADRRTEQQLGNGSYSHDEADRYLDDGEEEEEGDERPLLERRGWATAGVGGHSRMHTVTMLPPGGQLSPSPVSPAVTAIQVFGSNDNTPRPGLLGAHDYGGGGGGGGGGGHGGDARSSDDGGDGSRVHSLASISPADLDHGNSEGMGGGGGEAEIGNGYHRLDDSGSEIDISSSIPNNLPNAPGHGGLPAVRIGH